MGVKRRYKDSMFRALFNDEEKLLELYSALSGRDYPKGTDIEIVTLENAIYGDIKNDLAFIVENRLIIMIEHQSTVNPNMPFRMLSYVIREYERQGFNKNLYDRKLVKIPTPELYVFYNGSERAPKIQSLKFSDAFKEKCDKITIEAIVKVINVNYETGAEILDRCRTLKEYSDLIYRIRAKQKAGQGPDDAVRTSVRECIDEGILKEFLMRKGGEIMDFIEVPMTREECEAIVRQGGYEEGLEDNQRSIAKKMLARGMDIDVIMDITGLAKESVLDLKKK